MPTKQEYETTFNELFELDIVWSKLNKEELAQLAIIFAHPEILLKKLGIDENFEDGYPPLILKLKESLFTSILEKVENYDGPIVSKLREATKKTLK